MTRLYLCFEKISLGAGGDQLGIGQNACWETMEVFLDLLDGKLWSLGGESWVVKLTGAWGRIECEVRFLAGFLDGWMVDCGRELVLGRKIMSLAVELVWEGCQKKIPQTGCLKQ